MLLIPVPIMAYMVGGYYLILAPGSLYNAIVSEDWDMFSTVMARFAIIATAVLFVKVLRGVLRESCSNLLRNRITTRLHAFYVGSSLEEGGYMQSTYYKVCRSKSIDNPDQRIPTDTRDFALSLFSILGGGGAQGPDSGGLIEALASVLFYSRRTFLRTGWFGLCAAYLWSIVVGGFSVFAINWVSPSLFKQERLEADLRFEHASLRKHAEEIAFLRGGPYERRSLNERLSLAVENTWSVIGRRAGLNAIDYGYGYYISLVMYTTLAVAVRKSVFSSELGFPASGTAGEKAQWVAQSGGIFVQLLYSFTMVVQLGNAVSLFVSNAQRLCALVDELEGEKASPTSQDESTDEESASKPLIGSSLSSSSSSSSSLTTSAPPLTSLAADDRHKGGATSDTLANDAITADRLQLVTADGKRIGPFSLRLPRGRHALLCGATGSGKTSVLRALRGLWPPSAGTISLPPAHKVAFVPQTPYVPPGATSLCGLLTYPRVPRRRDGEQVAGALRRVGWRGACDVDDVLAETDWAARLSPGERQLVAAARLLVMRPGFAVLDEPTSALDPESEASVISAIREAGISTLIVSHSAALRGLHDADLVWLQE